MGSRRVLMKPLDNLYREWVRSRKRGAGVHALWDSLSETQYREKIEGSSLISRFSESGHPTTATAQKGYGPAGRKLFVGLDLAIL